MLDRGRRGRPGRHRHRRHRPPRSPSGSARSPTSASPTSPRSSSAATPTSGRHPRRRRSHGERRLMSRRPAGSRRATSRRAADGVSTTRSARGAAAAAVARPAPDSPSAVVASPPPTTADPAGRRVDPLDHADPAGEPTTRAGDPTTPIRPGDRRPVLTPGYPARRIDLGRRTLVDLLPPELLARTTRSAGIPAAWGDRARPSTAACSIGYRTPGRRVRRPSGDLLASRGGRLGLDLESIASPRRGPARLPGLQLRHGARAVSDGLPRPRRALRARWAIDPRRR